jgi:hypothetical protein
MLAVGSLRSSGSAARVEPLGRAGHALGAVDLVEQDEHPGVAGTLPSLGSIFKISIRNIYIIA